MRTLKIVLIILGSVVALAGIGMLVGGLVLGWAYGTQRDDDGYFTTSSERFTTETSAITTETLDILIEPDAPSWFTDRLGEIRLRADSANNDLFVGIGPEAEVEAYLADVAHDEIVDIEYDPFGVEYRRQAGTRTPEAPADQVFWVAQSSGTGTQTLTWEIESGNWVAVLMNTDGSTGVEADVRVGARTDLLPGAIVLLVGAGILLLLGGTGLILWGSTGLGTATTALSEPAAQQPETPLYPLRLEGRLDEPLSRGLWLIKWLFAIPHFVILVFLGIAFVVLTLVAGIAILITGRYPRSIFNFNVGVMRWSWRVGYYATNAIATDRYPPFSLGVEPDYPASLEVAYPERLSRGLVLVKWWLLAIPHYLVLAVMLTVPFLTWGASEQADQWSTVSGGLIGLLVLIAGVVLLFRGRYPLGIFDFLMGINRWFYRVVAYATLMTDAYPPLRLDQGATEPRIIDPGQGELAGIEAP